MAYLISHIVVCLAFAQLLGLLLGWLLWGYAARQRGKEVQTLRERMADMQFMSAARIAMTPEPRIALSDVTEAGDKLPAALPSAFHSAELPPRPAARRAFFEDDTEQPSSSSLPEPVTLSSRPPGPTSANHPNLSPPPIAPDLEAEVRESKIQHLQQQVRELESFRERLPLLQAELDDAINGRKAAEARFQETKNDFELRSSSLLSQIRDFENAAGEWDHLREEFERDRLAQQKELAAVKATLRDLQNSQRPQAVDAAPAPPAASAVELADLRERYQKAVREREAASKELEFWKQRANGHSGETTRLAELEETVRSRDAQLSEQAARVESLLWRVAELEPFAAEVPHKEEILRRQESEIAGHMAMHAENAERIRSLQCRVEELESTTVPSEELQRMAAGHQAAIHELLADHEQRLAELQQAVAMKDAEIAEHVSARHGQLRLLEAMQAQLVQLESAASQIPVLQQALRDRDLEHQVALDGLQKHHEQRIAELQQAMQDRDLEHQAGMQVLLADHQTHVAELRAEQQQLLAAKEAEIADHLSARFGMQERITELEAVARHAQQLEQSLRERDGEFHALVAAHSQTQQEKETALRDVEWARGEGAAWKLRISELETAAAEQAAEGQRLAAEVQRLRDLNSDKEGQLTFVQERLGALSSRLAAHQQRLLQLEPLAARTPEMEKKLAEQEHESREQIKALEQQHHTELTRLKVNSAQRIRRFRQSMNSFKI